MSLDEIFKLICQFCALVKRKYYEPLGAILLVILVVFVANRIIVFLQNIPNVDKISIIAIKELPWQFGLYLILILFTLLFWIWKRKVPTFKNTQAGILFAPAHDEILEKELNDLEQRLQEEIRKTDFQDMIRIKRLPPNHRVGQHIDNIQVIQKSRARILICGRFEKFTIKGQELTGFSSLTVSCATLPVHPQYATNLLKDSISGKQWAWEIENTINRDVVASNLSEVSRYVIGLSLIAQRKFDKAQQVLGLLMAEMNSKYGQLRCPIETKRFKQRVADAYASAIDFEVWNCYSRELDNERIFQIPQNKIIEWKDRIANAIKVSEQNSNLYVQLAIYEFLGGDIRKSKEAIRKACQLLLPKQQSSCLLSEAFLFAFDGDLREAKRLYKRVLKSDNPPSANTIYQVVLFLHQTCERYPDKLEVRFLYGIFNYEFGDKNLAYKELEQFCNSAESKPELSGWVREARIRMERIENELDNEEN
jgi:hypothetical protein